jgi:hypothetical protein
VFERAGIEPARARELAIALLCALEGAFVLARAQRSTEPLALAGEFTAEAVRRALQEAARSGKPRLRARWPAAPA